MSDGTRKGATEEQRKNLYEPQKAWGDHAFGKLIEAETAGARPDLRRLVRHEEVTRDEPF